VQQVCQSFSLDVSLTGTDRGCATTPTL